MRIQFFGLGDSQIIQGRRAISSPSPAPLMRSGSDDGGAIPALTVPKPERIGSNAHAIANLLKTKGKGLGNVRNIGFPHGKMDFHQKRTFTPNLRLCAIPGFKQDECQTR
jgi:hypothetical protein